MKEIKIGILGFGTVGKGTFDILKMNKDSITRKSGCDIEVKKVFVRSPERAQELGLDSALAVFDPKEILNDPEIEIVVEALGGTDFPAGLMEEALLSGKGVVTPNKAALAENFARLKAASEKGNAELRFEASVGGGIPALTAIQEALAGNEFTEVMGIVNGTTNYILTKMTDEGLSYSDVLKDAQEKGFAEADPTTDVEGIDAANKLSILIALCFDEYIPPNEIPREGITGVTEEDISKAKEAGERIKLIAEAKKTEDGIKCSVKPTLLPLSHPLSGVSNEFNAIYVTGNAVGELMFYGRGAGALPTGSAVVGDIIAIAKNR